MYLAVVATLQARRSALVLSACVFACGPQTEDGGGGTESTSVADASGDGDGDGDGGDGPAFGGNCGSLPPEGPTIAPDELGPSGFPMRCNPRTQSGGGAYTCCSDDPAAVGGALPAYDGKGVEGDTPIFSGDNNDLSTWGVCVKTADIPAGSGLQEAAAANCPVPCNPTWDAASIETVCGPSRVCCQTQELQASDCVQDIVTGQWRAVTGLDIGATNPDGSIVTDWTVASHATHQDPGGLGCIEITGDNFGPAFQDCVLQLSVADQRGFCMALGPGQTCPLAQPTYVDACEALNM